MTPRIRSAAVAAIPMLAGFAAAQTITFENVAPAGGVHNVGPSTPYTESGFTFTPSTALSAIFDSAGSVQMPGDTTDFFGFAPGNIVTLTRAGGGVFGLASLLAGPSSLAGGSTSLTMTAYPAGGVPVVLTPPDLATATLISPNWTNLTHVTFQGSVDSALDDLVLVVPCYANCDASTTAPVLNVLDFTCFLNRFAAGDTYANCDASTTPPVLNVLDFTCFLNQFAAGCP
jgi:hypothetical protein